MFRELRSLVICAGFLNALTPGAHGQAAAINGEITGVVNDASGAVVANAAVQVVNTATGFSAAARTENSGLYRFTLLPIGKYELKATTLGFADVQESAA